MAEDGKRQGPKTPSTESAYEADLKSFIKYIIGKQKKLEEYLKTTTEEYLETTSLTPAPKQLKLRYSFFREIRIEFQRYREVIEDPYAKVIARSENTIKCVGAIYEILKQICNRFEQAVKDKESYSFEEIDDLVNQLCNQIANLHAICQKKSTEIQVRPGTKRGKDTPSA